MISNEKDTYNLILCIKIDSSPFIWFEISGDRIFAWNSRRSHSCLKFQRIPFWLEISENHICWWKCQMIPFLFRFASITLLHWSSSLCLKNLKNNCFERPTVSYRQSWVQKCFTCRSQGQLPASEQGWLSGEDQGMGANYWKAIQFGRIVSLSILVTIRLDLQP